MYKYSVRNYLVFIFLICTYFTSTSQFIIKENWDHFFIEENSLILEMNSETEFNDLDIVQGKYDQNFQPFSMNSIKGKETYNWIKLEVENQTNKAIEVYLGTNRFEKMIFYKVDYSTISQPQISGSLIPIAEKPIQIEGLSFFKSNIESGITKLYVKVINQNAPSTPQFSFPLVVCNEKFYKNNYEKTSDFTYLFLGAIGIMFLYNFLLFLSTGQKSFLYYSGYVFFVSIFVLGLVPQFAFKLFGHMDINKVPISSSGTISSIFYILFGMEIMETKKYYPKVSLFLKFLIILLTIALLSVFDRFVEIASFLNFFAAFFMSPTLLVLGFLMVLKKHRPGTIFFIANLIFIIGLLVFLLTLTNVIPNIIFGFSGINIYQICLLFSLALYSLGIASKINEIKELSHLKELESIRAHQLTLENEEISKEKKKAEQALSELKATQALLIQNEKMASLGELTAGIAHEIQNPLNFVNNFSELSVEISNELKEEIIKLNLQKSEKDNIDEIVDSLTSNQIKINHHGKRAAEIVKGMLHHSRSSSGQKELIDINDLVEEYLNLAYHGLRSKPNKHNFSLKSELDPSKPKINVISQDIGRVILNLVTNAIHAVSDKAKSGLKGFEPIVTVSTKVVDNKWIEIIVKDNGSGISSHIKDKIFQPFFTTKPSGEGTGLGLSLAYDIVKAHGGDINLKSEEGTGTEFIINLPVS